MIALDFKYDTSMDKPKENPKLQQMSSLDRLKDVFFDYFEQLVEDCCYRIEIEFGVQLGQKRSLISKEEYTDLLKSLRDQKTSIKKDYLIQIETLFNADKTKPEAKKNIDVLNATLTKDDSVEEDYVIKKIIRHTNHLFLAELAALNKKFAKLRGKRTISDLEVPVCPANLVYALTQVINPMDLESDYKTALYKVFDEKVFSQLGFIYKELNNTAIDRVTPLQIVKEEVVVEPFVEPVAKDNEETQKIFIELKKRIVNWRSDHSPSAYDLLPQPSDLEYEVFEIINALEILRQFSIYEDIDFATIHKPIKWLVIQKLEEIKQEDIQKCITQNEEDLFDLISLLFQHIKEDETVPQILRLSILKLEFSIAEFTLNDYGFLFAANGMGRQLIDNLYSAAQFLNLEDHGNTAINEHINKLINIVCTDASCGVDEIQGLVNNFSDFMEKNRKRSHIFQQRTLQLVKNKEALELSKQAVNREILQCIQERVLPEKITDFLFNVWQDLLLVVYIRKEEEPESWDNAVYTMKNLILSVIPPKNDDERKKILKLLPAIIKDLRAGLKRISYDKHSQSRFFKELAVYHVLLMNNNEYQDVEGEKKTNIQVIDDKINTNYDIDDNNYIQVKDLKLNQWLAFTIDEVVHWGQLIWHSSETEHHLFTDKNGKKLLELELSELIELFNKGQVKIVSFYQQAFTERILSHL